MILVGSEHERGVFLWKQRGSAAYRGVLTEAEGADGLFAFTWHSLDHI